MTDAETFELINNAFKGVIRPTHFTKYWHCEECKEHDDLMRSRTLDTLTIEDVGNPGWNPVCFLTPQGFLYYFPAFVRLTFEDPDDSFLPNLLFHLSNPDMSAEHFSLFNRQQREATLALLCHIRDHHMKTVEFYGCDDQVEPAIKAWRSFVEVGEQQDNLVVKQPLTLNEL